MRSAFLQLPALPALAVVLVSLLGTGCPKPPCNPGTAECACRSGNTCDDGLSCQSGTCKSAPACTPGTLDCACGTGCGAGLACESGICRTPTTPLEGTPGGRCYPNNTCNSGYECVAGTCQDPACPVGSIGCPCGAEQTCTDSALSCQEGTCAVAGCEPGTSGCLCNGGACVDGLQCVSNFCRGGNILTLTLSNPAVRACELVFEPGTRAITAVSFKDGVVGESMENEGRRAVAFTARRDSALADPILELTLAGIQTAAPSDAVPALARCVDRLGRSVQSPGLTFH